MERLAGNATTDFGAPGIAPSIDSLPMGADKLNRSQILLEACWRALDTPYDQRKAGSCAQVRGAVDGTW